MDGDVRSEYSELLLRLSAGTTAGQEVMLAGTKMDYEAVGLAGVLALDSSNRYHNPVDAARNLLNLSSESQKVSVALAGSQTTEAVNGEWGRTWDGICSGDIYRGCGRHESGFD